MKYKLTMLAVAGLVAASVSVSKAQPYAIAGDFNGWNNSAPLGGGPTIYTNIMTGGAPGTYESFKIIAVPGSWNTTYPGNNCQIKYDATGGNTVYFYPGTILDGWSPLNNRVGYEDPGNMAWELTGDFTTPQWGSDPNAQMVSAGNGVYTNTYIVATPGTYNFKFRTPGTWSEVNFGSDFGNGGGNAVFTTTEPNQAVLFKLDLPNGRWLAGNPPTFCDVRFQVDMSAVLASDPGFDPSSVTVNGDAIGWGGTPCTNNPAAANTNIYSAVFTLASGTSVNYQFRYLGGGNTVYDALGDFGGVNRSTVVPNLTHTNIPAVYFNDATTNDYLTATMAVTFAVDMNGAVGIDNTAWTEGSGIPVFVNGPWLSWLSWNPPALISRQLFEAGTSGIFTNTFLFPAGFVSSITYKYSLGGTDNEAGSNTNRFRIMRTTATGAYNLAQDKFGSAYVEPSFGQLAVGKMSAGMVPLTWLGRPGCEVQTSSSLSGGVWTSLPQTDGTNWTAGTVSTNGLLSTTNWPAAGGNLFFRLIKQ